MTSCRLPKSRTERRTIETDNSSSRMPGALRRSAMVSKSGGQARNPIVPLPLRAVAMPQYCPSTDATFGPDHPVDWKAMAGDYDVIRDHIARVIPGFEDFNARIRTKNGFVLPNPPRDTRSFKTDIGRGRFTVSPLEYLTPPQGTWSCRPSAATTSTTPRSTAWMTGTAGSRTAAG